MGNSNADVSRHSPVKPVEYDEQRLASTDFGTHPSGTAPEHLERLRGRGLSAKRSLALRELALGLEALHRFVEREPFTGFTSAFRSAGARKRAGRSQAVDACLGTRAPRRSVI